MFVEHVQVLLPLTCKIIDLSRNRCEKTSLYSLVLVCCLTVANVILIVIFVLSPFFFVLFLLSFACRLFLTH
jgi:hypothetical protein